MKSMTRSSLSALRTSYVILSSAIGRRTTSFFPTTATLALFIFLLLAVGLGLTEDFRQSGARTFIFFIGARVCSERNNHAALDQSRDDETVLDELIDMRTRLFVVVLAKCFVETRKHDMDAFVRRSSERFDRTLDKLTMNHLVGFRFRNR